MKFVIRREALLTPLSLVAGVVERRHTLPVLANILLVLEGQQLSLTGTDLEVELVGRAMLEEAGIDGSVTIPARKLLDICKSLPDNTAIEVECIDGHVFIKAGSSKFKLTTLPADNFPNIEDSPESLEIELSSQDINTLIDTTSFAMAHSDVRFYLNGMLLEMGAGELRTVATDGHRMATKVHSVNLPDDAKRQIIIPRKGVQELAKLIQSKESEQIKLVIGASHVRVFTQNFIFTSKLVDSKFPDYEQVMPRHNDRNVLVDRLVLKSVLSRAAILSNEKLRGVRLMLNSSNLQVVANNPEHEEAEENLEVDYSGEEIEIGFNVGYLIDVLNVIETDNVLIALNDNNTSALITAEGDQSAQYVVMPMRL